MWQRAVLPILPHRPVTALSVTMPMRQPRGEGACMASFQASDVTAMLLGGQHVRSCYHSGWCASHHLGGLPGSPGNLWDRASGSWLRVRLLPGYVPRPEEVRGGADLVGAHRFLFFPVRGGALRMHPAHAVCRPVQVHGAVSVLLPYLPGHTCLSGSLRPLPEPRAMRAAQWACSEQG